MQNASPACSFGLTSNYSCNRCGKLPLLRRCLILQCESYGLHASIVCIRSVFRPPFRMQLAASNLKNNMAAPAEITVSIGYCGALLEPVILRLQH